MPDIGVDTRTIKGENAVPAIKKLSFIWVFIVLIKILLELVLQSFCVCVYLYNEFPSL